MGSSPPGGYSYKQISMAMAILSLTLSLVTIRTQSFDFTCVCSNDAFEDSDIRLQCVYQLLDKMDGSVMHPPESGEMKVTEDCYGSSVYGYRWADLANGGPECLNQAKSAIEETCCHHSQGAQVRDNGGVCRMRFELYAFNDGT